MNKTILFNIILFCQIIYSQNRAPSCWLKYQDFFQGDIIINKIKVKSPSPTYTYYCSLQWNAGMEGGGYCGIQEHPDGRNFIFSIWDPISSSEAITAPYTHPGTLIESFGGEGTGLKSWNFNIGWNEDQWYSFISRAWSVDSHTMFGFWIFSHSDQEWFHLVTMDYPVNNIRFNSRTGSFIEDWVGNGWNSREVHHQSGWKRKTSDLSWFPFSNSLFDRVSPDAGANNYINNYDGGVASDYYFMKSGGATTPITNTSNSLLSLTNSNLSPGYGIGNVLNLDKSISINNLQLNWNLELSKPPQFSYDIKIFDNPTFSGIPIIHLNDNIPHLRSKSIDTNNLLNGNEYYLQFFIVDIFDNQSTIISDSFIAQTTTLGTNTFNNNSLSYYPNPVENTLNINLKNINIDNISIYDISGKKIIEISHIVNNQIDVSPLEKGVYVLSLETTNGLIKQKFVKN